MQIAKEFKSHNTFVLTLLCLASLLVGIGSVYTDIILPVLFLIIFIPLVVFVLQRYQLLALHLFIIVLPASTFILVLLYGVVGVPARTLKLGLYWEETLPLFVFIIVILQGIGEKFWHKSINLHLVDLLVLLASIQVGIYILLIPIISPKLSPLDIARAIRDDLLFFIVYFIGRATPLSDLQAWRVLRSLIMVAMTTILFGFIERLLIPIDFFIKIKMPDFFTLVVGYTFSSASFGLPDNFFGAFGNQIVRRATSIYTSSQPFAISFMIFLPVCFWLAARLQPRPIPFVPRSRTMIIWTLLAFGALALTVTRANIILGGVQLLIAVLMLRTRIGYINRSLAWISIALSLSLLGFFAVAYEPILTLVRNTLTFTEGSSASHKGSWITDLQHLADYPFGRGIGTAGVTAARSAAGSDNSAGGEGQFSKIVRELGLPGLVLYVGILVTTIGAAYQTVQRYKASNDGRSGLSFVVFLGGIALLLNSLTTEWQGALSTSLVYWWLAGTVVRTTVNNTTNTFF